MPYSESVPMKLPSNAIEAVQASVLPLPIPADAVLELVISLDSTGIKARDLASYLSLIDHVYGRLDPKGLLSYAHRKEGHVELSHVREGSVELVISELVRNSTTLLFLYLVLRYLPEFVRGLVGSWKDAEEALLLRLRRKELRDRMRRDAELDPVSDNHIKQIVEVLDTTYSLESDNLPGAQRLARVTVRSVRIRVISVGPDEPDETPERD
jgi:hypothetical protein